MISYSTLTQPSQYKPYAAESMVDLGIFEIIDESQEPVFEKNIADMPTTEVRLIGTSTLNTRSWQD